MLGRLCSTGLKWATVLHGTRVGCWVPHFFLGILGAAAPSEWNSSLVAVKLLAVCVGGRVGTDIMLGNCSLRDHLAPALVAMFISLQTTILNRA